MKICRALGAAAALSLLAGATANAGMIIDSFGTTQSLSVGPGGGNPLSATDGVAAVDAVGGTRELTLTRTDGVSLLSTRVNIEAGIFGFGAEPGVGGSVEAWYDGTDDMTFDPMGLGGMDFTEGGMNMSVRIAYRYDLAVDFRVRIYTDAANFSEAIFNFSAGTPGFNVPFNEMLLPFGAFVTVAGSGADFTNVGALTFYAETDSMLGADFQLDYIDLTRDVPAPSALALLGVGALACSRRRRA